MARWVAWTFLTLLSWGLWAVLSKLIGGSISDAQIQVISTLGVLPIIFALSMVKAPAAAGNRRRGVLLALGSGIISCLGNIAYYEALNHAKAATVIPLTALYPVVTVLLAIPLLKEHVNLPQWIGIGLSLAAIYLFNVPQATTTDGNLASGWMVLPLAAVVLWGITALMQKVATNHISARSSAIWFLAAFIPVAGLLLIYDPLESGIKASTWWIATAMGFTLALGNLTILLAFSTGGKASIITPLAGLYPLVSIPIALVAFGERIGWRESLGIVLALVAVVMLSYQPEPAQAPASRETG
jgi:bacterial/archaeal transporter family protein